MDALFEAGLMSMAMAGAAMLSPSAPEAPLSARAVGDLQAPPQAFALSDVAIAPASELCLEQTPLDQVRAVEFDADGRIVSAVIDGVEEPASAEGDPPVS